MSWLVWVGVACLVSIYAGVIVFVMAFLFDRGSIQGIIRRAKNIFRRA
jgi:hypothetical protein